MVKTSVAAGALTDCDCYFTKRQRQRLQSAARMCLDKGTDKLFGSIDG